MPDSTNIVAGVLALQGDFEAHAKMLRLLDAEVVYVRRPEQLEQAACLCMPGGESTTMSLLLDSAGLREPLRERIADGMPVLATCAGAILLGKRLGNDSGSLKVKPLQLLDATVERNAYGRQVDSFEAELDCDWAALGLPEQADLLRAAFIRAPLLRDPGKEVQVVARRGNEIVLLRQGNILAATFHPEIVGEPRLHQALLQFLRK